jgi:diguanylate cyclase (GGDEF)-like protein/PAS domain S-box-containing protein
MTGLTILYLDSDTNHAQQVQRYLHWQGYQVDCAHDHQECQYKIRNHDYAILVLALSTPHQADFRLLETLKIQQRHLPTIIIGQRQDFQTASKAMQMGCHDFLVKNVLIKTFFEQLNVSLFRVREKLLTQQQENQHKLCSQHQQTLKKLSDWEYYPSQNIVSWQQQINKDKTLLDYEEFLDNVREDDRNKVRTQINICLFSGQTTEFRFRYFLSEHLITFQANLQAHKNSSGEVTRLTATFREVDNVCHEDDHAQLKLAFLDNTADSIFITDENQRIVSVNDNFCTLSGYSEGEILNQKSDILNDEDCDTVFFRPIIQTLKQQHFWQGEMSLRHRLGHSLTVWQSISVLKNGHNSIARSISVLRDISQQKAYESSIQFLANYDPLTQLPNRTLFHDRLSNAIKQCNRNHNKLAVMLLDLDKFKWINDTIGHHAGDILLQETGKKLQAAVRNSDTVARLGGDEFAIILADMERATDSEVIARKIFAGFQRPIHIDQHQVFIRGSIGITLYPDDGLDIDQLLKNADSAMYQAKHSGCNNYFYFTRALQQQAEQRQQLIDEIRYGLSNNQFELYYQPIIDQHTQKVACAETLLRWQHPTRGNIPLHEFMPLAEESGLICDIGNWVVAKAAANMNRWSQKGIAPLGISLNQSVAQYSPANCHQTWLDTLRQNKIPASAITFEINEKILIDESDDHHASIRQLQQEGAKISLDGFGTGYSSISYLKKYPVDVIKIDRSCIHHITDDPITAIMVEAIVNLANKLGIKVIATGIENRQQLSQLNNQCRFVQGYYFSKPLAIADFEQFLRMNNS